MLKTLNMLSDTARLFCFARPPAMTALSLNFLAVVLLSQFEVCSWFSHEIWLVWTKIEDLETAIGILREGLALLPVYHPIHLAGFTNFAIALIEQFNHLGGQEDGWGHFGALRAAWMDSYRPRSLHNLTDTATIRNHYFGRPSDEVEPIPLHQVVLEQWISPLPEHLRSFNIAATLTVHQEIQDFTYWHLLKPYGSWDSKVQKRCGECGNI